LFTGSVTLEAGKFVTLHLTDTGANAAMVVVEDNVALPDSGFSRYKFVNLHPNQVALDLYHGTVKVASNIPYKGSSPEFTLVSTTAGSWAIRPAGAAPTSAALHSYSNTIPNQRVLTVFARGYTGVTGVRAPAISLLYNR
jgi:predicted aspartyl protease